MTSPTAIVTGILRRLIASPDSITNTPQQAPDNPKGQLKLESSALQSLPISLSWRNLVLPVGLGVIFLWAFAPTLADLAHNWSEPEYSHGYLVPVFSLVLLWLRRDLFKGAEFRCSWWGLALLGLGVAVRFAADFLFLDWLDATTLLLCVAGLTILLGGWAALRWAWPAMAFLAFMIPLPYTLRVVLANPLQHVATLASTYALQTLGFPALSEGNVILINETRIGVVEACSGLNMLVIFFALSTAFAFVVNQPLWQKLVLVVSAVPIALISNITRITVTGIMHETVGHKAADLVFHDLAGWLMMPFALMILWLELKAFTKLFVEVTEPERARFSSPGFPTKTANGKSANGKRRRSQKIFLPPASHGPRQA